MRSLTGYLLPSATLAAGSQSAQRHGDEIRVIGAHDLGALRNRLAQAERDENGGSLIVTMHWRGTYVVPEDQRPR